MSLPVLTTRTRTLNVYLLNDIVIKLFCWIGENNTWVPIHVGDDLIFCPVICMLYLRNCLHPLWIQYLYSWFRKVTKKV